MDQEIFDLLARCGLKVPTDSVSVHGWGPKQVRALHEPLWNTIYHLQYASDPSSDDPRLFRFVASASLRAEGVAAADADAAVYCLP